MRYICLLCLINLMEVADYSTPSDLRLSMYDQESSTKRYAKEAVWAGQCLEVKGVTACEVDYLIISHMINDPSPNSQMLSLIFSSLILYYSSRSVTREGLDLISPYKYLRLTLVVP